jgi:hypothetical protein
MPRRDGNQRGTTRGERFLRLWHSAGAPSTDHDDALNHGSLIKIAQATDLLDASSGSA